MSLTFEHAGKTHLHWSREDAEAAGIPAATLDAAELAATRAGLICTRRQMKLELASRPSTAGNANLLEDVDAWVATQPIEVQIDWSEASGYRRTYGVVETGGAALGLSDPDLDALFVAAKARP